MKLTLYSSLFVSAFYLPSSTVAQSDGTLRQPSELSSNGNNLEIDLPLVEGQHNTVAADTFNTRLLGGTLPGPTVRVRPGDWLYVNFDNELDQQSGTNTSPNDFAYPDSSNLHFHGAHVSGERPGDDTTLIIDAGESYRYEVFFPQFHMGGTHWIHPHRHGSGTIQVAGGAASVLIVEDEPGDVPPEVENAEEVILMTQLFDTGRMDSVTQRSNDRLFELDSNVGDDFILVNGQYQPTLEITAGEWQRWRVVYAAWDRNPLDLSIQTNGNCEVNLLAKDGIYINDYPRPITFFPISTAGRADIMVRCRSTGSWTVDSYLGDLFELRSVAPPGGNGAIDVSTPPTSNYDFPQPTYLNDLRNRNPTPGCSCDTFLSNDRLNGISYNPNLFLHEVALGSIVERRLDGVSNHPYHQHVYPFQITQFFGVSGNDADYHRLGDYHDVLMLRSSTRVNVRYEANNFHGRMAVHCHRLTHSDEGMLLAEIVTDPNDGGVCRCSPRNNAQGFTRPPTSPPTNAPQPTNAPVPSPTTPPTPNPTPNPIPNPTPNPVPNPTQAPQPGATDPPIPNPTNAPPVPLPTVAPQPLPTVAPQPLPTVAPQPMQTNAPVSGPTPTQEPAPTNKPKKTKKPKKPKTKKPKKPKTMKPRRMKKNN